MVLVKRYQRSKLFLVLLDERPHEKSWGFLFLSSGCNLTPSSVCRSCYVVSHKMFPKFPLYPKYQEKMFPLYPKFPLFLIIPTYCFAQTMRYKFPDGTTGGSRIVGLSYMRNNIKSCGQVNHGMKIIIKKIQINLFYTIMFRTFVKQNTNNYGVQNY